MNGESKPESRPAMIAFIMVFSFVAFIYYCALTINIQIRCLHPHGSIIA
jgi:hypothetical protein